MRTAPGDGTEPSCSSRPSWLRAWPGAAPLPPPAATHGVRVVAAENFWGSIARQLGGTHASVQSIITNPAQDPHSYEPTSGDARTMATAQLAIVNGVGYDPWAPKLLAANPVQGRDILDRREPVRPQGRAEPAPLVRPL